jgi:hypothetical protein
MLYEKLEYYLNFWGCYIKNLNIIQNFGHAIRETGILFKFLGILYEKLEYYLNFWACYMKNMNII